METATKPYLFPDGKFDPDTVPTPWFKWLKRHPESEWLELHAAAVPKARAWFIGAFPDLDDEDRDYALYLFTLMGNPLLRHEALNLMLILKKAKGG